MVEVAWWIAEKGAGAFGGCGRNGWRGAEDRLRNLRAEEISKKCRAERRALGDTVYAADDCGG